MLLFFTAVSVHAKPFTVSTEVTISNGGWYPLPEAACSQSLVAV